MNALIVPRVDKTNDAVFDLTLVEFDAASRQYAERRFGQSFADIRPTPIYCNVLSKN